MSRPKKRSVIIDGRKTSVSLEDEYFHYLQVAAKGLNTTFTALVIDVLSNKKPDESLSGAVRLHAFDLARRGGSGDDLARRMGGAVGNRAVRPKDNPKGVA